MCEGDTEKTKHDLPHLGQGDDSVGKVLEIQARGRCEFAYVIKKKKNRLQCCALTVFLPVHWRGGDRHSLGLASQINNFQIQQ